MEFLAHKSGNKKETIIEHLTSTAAYAAVFGDAFNSAKIAQQLGLLHDVGKLTKSFQNVLSGVECKKDHAIIAGIYYYKYGKIADTWLKKHMSLAMACHHCNLYGKQREMKDIFKEDNVTKFDFGLHTTYDAGKTVVVSDVNEWNAICQFISDNDLLLDLTSDDYLDISDMSANEKMFYLRMLYSCLVDADYTATCMFEDDSYYERSEKELFDVDVFLSKLDAYKNTLSVNVSPMSNIRNQVYDTCSKKGSMMTGLCTLTAPTGSGKTLALAKFALENAKAYGRKKIIIVLPYLSIIAQNVDVYKKVFGDNVVLMDDSQTEYSDETRLYSDRWSSPIIVTTSVKFFETLFSNKASRIRHLHQVANSVIVFDECQTLSSSILSTSFEILQSLGKYYNTTVLLSTATKPSYEYRNVLKEKVRNIAGNLLISKMEWVDNELIDDLDNLYSQYALIKKLQVDSDVNKTYDLPDLLEYYLNESQVLYVFNTVKHAMDMYKYLCEHKDKNNCYLITSRLCSHDKLSIIDEINEKLRAGLPVYLAATQCIEAGVDFDFPVGAREYGPFDSVIQTAGRINRNCKFDSKYLVFLYKDHGSYDYPSLDYKWASDITYNLAKNFDFNLYDLSLMDVYFEQLFHSVNYKSDDELLYAAILDFDYSDLKNRYKLIKNQNQVMIIVKPVYDFNENEYNDMIDDIVNNNYTITKDLMRRLSKYTVSTYVFSKTNFGDFGHQLAFRRHMDSKTNWYLSTFDDIYDADGLHKDRNVSFVF